MIKGRIFDIQRGTFSDGPGIRTTVYFKGCNMRCVWCHNPESQEFYSECMFDSLKCKGCGKCVAACKQNACDNIIIDRTKCINCGKCSEVCMYGAKTTVGHEISVMDLEKIILADKDFFDNSGGGVTFSGGEPLIQAEFIREISKRCCSKNINVAIDTAGYVEWKVIENVLPFVNIFLYDMKAIDDTVHKKCTGVSNKVILENLVKLDKTGVAIEIRVPIIPGYNDKETERIADFITKLNNVTAVKVLPYHKYGENKYINLGRKHENIKASDKTEQYFNDFKKKGINVK